MVDVSEIILNGIRENPLAYYKCGDRWYFNFAILNYNLKKFELRLNPKAGTDESVTDYITAHDINVAEWFFSHLHDTDYFIPIE